MSVHGHVASRARRALRRWARPPHDDAVPRARCPGWDRGSGARGLVPPGLDENAPAPALIANTPPQVRRSPRRRSRLARREVATPGTGAPWQTASRPSGSRPARHPGPRRRARCREESEKNPRVVTGSSTSTHPCHWCDRELIAAHPASAASLRDIFVEPGSGPVAPWFRGKWKSPGLRELDRRPAVLALEVARRAPLSRPTTRRRARSRRTSPR